MSKDRRPNRARRIREMFGARDKTWAGNNAWGSLGRSSWLVSPAEGGKLASFGVMG